MVIPMLCHASSIKRCIIINSHKIYHLLSLRLWLYRLSLVRHNRSRSIPMPMLQLRAARASWNTLKRYVLHVDIASVMSSAWELPMKSQLDMGWLGQIISEYVWCLERLTCWGKPKSSGHVIPRFWGWERDVGCCYSTSVGSKWSTSLQAVLISFSEEVVFSWFCFCLTNQNDVQHTVILSSNKISVRFQSRSFKFSWNCL